MTVAEAEAALDAAQAALDAVIDAGKPYDVEYKAVQEAETAYERARVDQ